MPVLKRQEQLAFDLTDVEPRGPTPATSAPVVSPRNTRWARPPDRPEWHLVRGPDSGVRMPICGATVWLQTAGEATLRPDRAHVFGPVCGICVREA